MYQEAPRFQCEIRKSQKFRMDYMWAQMFKTYYRLNDLATNWDQARQICEAEGTYLFIPDSLDEMESFKLLMSNMKAQYTGIFMGLHDKFSDGNFVTLKGESIAGTTIELLWAQGSPDNVNGTEHCVVMTREGLLDDRPCDDIYPFVCKILGSEIEFNEKCNNFDLAYIPRNNGKCYKFHAEPLSWYDAYLICKSEEGNLAIVNSADEASFITEMLSENLDRKVPDPNILFIGFSDLMFPFQYRTILGQSLEDAGYSTWGHIEEQTSKLDSNHCGAITSEGFLQITRCNRSAMFLCEKIINNTAE
uniref:Low-expression lectin 2 n=1 Tax=Bombyx mori TaxID=7091 RepID=B3IYT2_BOMMO|nr:low-expression lectin 2 [Bombyx mori]